MSLVGIEFLVSHLRLRTPRHFHRLSSLELCLTTNIKSFTRGGIYPCLLLPDTSFLYHFIQPCNSVRRRPMEPSSSNQSPNTVLIITMHSHPFNAMSPHICNAMRHCMLYHVTCIMNATWTTQSTLLTECHGKITSPAYDFHTTFHSCQCIMHAYININIQHVILCSSNDTHTIKSCNGHLHIEIHLMSIH